MAARIAGFVVWRGIPPLCSTEIGDDTYDSPSRVLDGPDERDSDGDNGLGGIGILVERSIIELLGWPHCCVVDWVSEGALSTVGDLLATAGGTELGFDMLLPAYDNTSGCVNSVEVRGRAIGGLPFPWYEWEISVDLIDWSTVYESNSKTQKEIISLSGISLDGPPCNTLGLPELASSPGDIHSYSFDWCARCSLFFNSASISSTRFSLCPSFSSCWRSEISFQ